MSTRDRGTKAQEQGLERSPGFTVSAVAGSGTGCRHSGRAEMLEGDPRRNGEDAEQRVCWKSCSVSTVRDSKFRSSFGASSSPEMLHSVL